MKVQLLLNFHHSVERQLVLLRVAKFGMAYMRSKKTAFNAWALYKVCTMNAPH